MASAFQSSAFQNNAFQVGALPTDDFQIIHGGNDNWKKNWRTEWENEKYIAEKKREQLKQEEIIKLKVEVQENIIEKNDLLKLEKSLQREKQLKAIQQKIDELYLIIQQENAKLNILQRNIVIYQNNMAIIALCAAYPFGGLHLTKQ